jgi:hypothetical protein
MTRQGQANYLQSDGLPKLGRKSSFLLRVGGMVAAIMLAIATKWPFTAALWSAPNRGRSSTLLPRNGLAARGATRRAWTERVNDFETSGF